jgi:hypothetical protein
MQSGATNATHRNECNALQRIAMNATHCNDMQRIATTCNDGLLDNCCRQAQPILKTEHAPDSRSGRARLPIFWRPWQSRFWAKMLGIIMFFGRAMSEIATFSREGGSICHALRAAANYARPGIECQTTL